MIEIPSFWLDCYKCILSIIVSWTDKSVSICEQLSSSGLLLVNINFIKKVCYQNSEIEVKEKKNRQDYCHDVGVSLMMVSVFLRS